VRTLIHGFVRRVLYQQNHVARVTQSQSIGYAQFFCLPLFCRALTVNLALGIGAQLGVHALDFRLANQPPAAGAEQQQCHARQQRREHGQSQAERMNHASLRKR
jgi:hypothetical protein